jgi:RimJ/RimL family protein N-acetyltransferase
VRSVVKLDIDNPEHAIFMHDLAVECRDEFISDYDPDIPTLMNAYNRAIHAGDTVAFLCLVDGAKAGIIWVDVDRYRIGYLHAGLMPAFRQGWNALAFLRQFIGFCFDTLGLESLEAHLPKYNKPAEKLVRRLGFEKYGLRPYGLRQGGHPQMHVLLALTKNDYEVKYG